MVTLEDFNHRLGSQDTLLKKKQAIKEYCFPNRSILDRENYFRSDFRDITPVLKELKWLSVESMLICRDCILVFKCLRGLAPNYLAKKFKKRSEIHNKDTEQE